MAKMVCSPLEAPGGGPYPSNVPLFVISVDFFSGSDGLDSDTELTIELMDEFKGKVWARYSAIPGTILPNQNGSVEIPILEARNLTQTRKGVGKLIYKPGRIITGDVGHDDWIVNAFEVVFYHQDNSLPSNKRVLVKRRMRHPAITFENGKRGTYFAWDCAE